MHGGPRHAVLYAFHLRIWNVLVDAAESGSCKLPLRAKGNSAGLQALVGIVSRRREVAQNVNNVYGVCLAMNNLSA